MDIAEKIKLPESLEQAVSNLLQATKKIGDGLLNLNQLGIENKTELRHFIEDGQQMIVTSGEIAFCRTSIINGVCYHLFSKPSEQAAERLWAHYSINVIKPALPVADSQMEADDARIVLALNAMQQARDEFKQAVMALGLAVMKAESENKWLLLTEQLSAFLNGQPDWACLTDNAKQTGTVTWKHHPDTVAVTLMVKEKEFEILF